MCNKKCQFVIAMIMKRVFYILFLFVGLSVSLFLFKAENNFAGTIALIVYVLIYKPLCDIIFLHYQYNYPFKDLIRKYPFWSYKMMKELYIN